MAKLKWKQLPSETLKVTAGFRLKGWSRDATPGWEGDRDDAEKFMAGRMRLLAELQERYFACAKNGDDRRILLVVQGLDTAGKGGVARHVMGMIDPQGVRLEAFGMPTKEELKHPFLWRADNRLPESGEIGLFDRSHYEDVLVPKAENTATPKILEERYHEINEWERRLIFDRHYTVIKLALMVSHDEQGMRLAQRLDRRDKWWKYKPSDIDTRRKWEAYQEAYQAMFDHTSTEWAPWYVVPADHKWYSRLAATEFLTQALISLDQHWPPAQWDFAVEKKRLSETLSPKAAAAVHEEMKLDGKDAQVDKETENFRKAVKSAREGKS